MGSRTMVIDVWGDFACFTRPEFKVERFSYPVPTPSAVRGIFDAIYCKPARNPSRAEFRWQALRIDVSSPPKYIALRRNEVKEKAVVKPGWLTGREQPEPIWADGTGQELGTDMKGRTQRQTMALKGVHYRLYAAIRPWPGSESKLPALEAQFERRARNGKCFFQPYLGCREFPAFFESVDSDSPKCSPYPFDLDIGLMLYDVFDLSRAGSDDTKPCISLFRATVRGGVLEIPDYESDQVLKGVRREP